MNGNGLNELRKFLEFLKHTWGTLAGISIFFPLSNVLLPLIPLGSWPDRGGLAFLEPQFVTVFATVACLFVVLWTFGQRGDFKQRTRAQLHRGAWLSFGLGVLSLILYLVLNVALTLDFQYTAFGWESADPRRALFDALLMLVYACFFTLLTRAFVVLGLSEYLDTSSSS